MWTRISKLAAVCLTLLAIASTSHRVESRQTRSASTSENPAVYTQESVVAAPGYVKLRKLHLVRPDLIPYPIAYDIYC